jgi:hypothetical protein
MCIRNFAIFVYATKFIIYHESLAKFRIYHNPEILNENQGETSQVKWEWWVGVGGWEGGCCDF